MSIKTRKNGHFLQWAGYHCNLGNMPSGVYVIIPAAGAGKRMPGPGPKQFRLLVDRPVLAWSASALLACKDVRGLVVGVSPEYKDKASEILRIWLKGRECRLAEGGDERRDTVRKCLAQVPEDAELVAIHDAARPFIRPEVIGEAIREARICGAVSVGIRPADTIRIEDGGPGRTLERENLWRVQTPQVFKRDLIAQAHARAAEEGFVGTDDAVLVERIGHPVKMVEADEFNFKLTTPADWLMAEALVKVGAIRPSRF